MTKPAEWTPGVRITSDLAVAPVDRYNHQLLSLRFVESYPFNPKHPESLVYVEYWPELMTRADNEAFQQAIVEKYGNPVSGPATVEPNSYGSSWCAMGQASEVNGQVSYNCFTAERHPVLQMFYGWLILRDEGLWQREAEERNKQKTTAPQL